MRELILEKAASNLIDEIKKLSRQDQAAIAVAVLGTLDGGGEEFDDEELLRELQRREAAGMDGSVSWSVLRDMPSERNSVAIRLRPSIRWESI